MANTIYPNFAQLMLGQTASHSLPDLSTAGAECRLIDLGTYTYSATHEDEADLSGIVATVSLSGNTVSAGQWDATTPITFSSVTGNSVEAVVFSYDAGGATSSNPLILYIDVGVGGTFVATPNGGDIEVALGSSIISLTG